MDQRLSDYEVPVFDPNAMRFYMNMYGLDVTKLSETEQRLLAISVTHGATRAILDFVSRIVSHQESEELAALEHPQQLEIPNFYVES